MIQIKNNTLAIQIVKKRWLRNLNWFQTPKTGWIPYHEEQFFVDLTDWKGPSYHVLNWGIDSYESFNLNLLSTFFENNPNAVFFDIGANIGIFSFKLAINFPSLNIYSFEPDPLSFYCISKSLEQHKEQVHLFQLAFSDSTGSSILFSDEKNKGGHSLNKTSILDEGNKISSQFKVKTDTLDNFVRENNIERIDLIKLDVQRHEAKVLSGAENTISVFRPVILMECCFEDINSGLLETFTTKNYQAIHTKTRKICEITIENLLSFKNKNEAYADFLFFPKEKAHTLQQQFLSV